MSLTDFDEDERITQDDIKMIVDRLVLNHFLDSSAKEQICEVVSNVVFHIIWSSEHKILSDPARNGFPYIGWLLDRVRISICNGKDTKLGSLFSVQGLDLKILYLILSANKRPNILIIHKTFI